MIQVMRIDIPHLVFMNKLLMPERFFVRIDFLLD